MAQRMRSFITFFILGVLLLGLGAHFSNTESYLNNFYQYESRARDFDHDGDCEQVSAHDFELLKIPQFNMLHTVPYIAPKLLVVEFSIPNHFFVQTHITSDYTLSIFRPPIA